MLVIGHFNHHFFPGSAMGTIGLPPVSKDEVAWERIMDDVFRSMREGSNVVLPALNGYAIRPEFAAFKLLGLKKWAERLGITLVDPLLKE